MTELEDLERFLQDQQRSADQMTVDWDQRRDQFLAATRDLVDTVRNLLRPLASKGLVQFSDTTSQISEWHAGRYHAPGLVAQLGSAQVELVPIGAEIAGAHGRVDLAGPQGQVPLLLLRGTSPQAGPGSNLSPDLSWKFMTPPPQPRYIDLDQNSLSRAIKGVIGA